MNIIHIRKLEYEKLNIAGSHINYNDKPLILESGYLPAPFGRADNGLVQLELLEHGNWQHLATALPGGIILIRKDEQSNKDYIHIHVFDNCPVFDADGGLLQEVDLTVPFKATYLLDISTIGYHGDHKPYLSIKVLQVRLLELNSLPIGMAIYHDIQSFRNALHQAPDYLVDQTCCEAGPVTWSDTNELLS
jgi:hypothetical protein